jgi:Flp pilus assembly protein TadG
VKRTDVVRTGIARWTAGYRARPQAVTTSLLLMKSSKALAPVFLLMTSAALIRLRTCSQVFLPRLRAMKRITRFLHSDSGASAAEFAIVLPLFLLMFFGIIVFGFYLALVHGVQQLAAEAARSSVPGLSETERASLAQSYVSDNVRSYGLIDPSKVAVSASASPTDANVFVVTVNYDASDSFIFGLRHLVPTPSPNIARSAAIPRGGF